MLLEFLAYISKTIFCKIKQGIWQQLGPQYWLSLKASSVDPDWDSRKQLSAHDLSFDDINVPQKLFLEVCNVCFTFFSVEAWSKYFIKWF